MTKIKKSFRPFLFIDFDKVIMIIFYFLSKSTIKNNYYNKSNENLHHFSKAYILLTISVFS